MPWPEDCMAAARRLGAAPGRLRFAPGAAHAGYSGDRDGAQVKAELERLQTETPELAATPTPDPTSTSAPTSTRGMTPPPTGTPSPTATRPIIVTPTARPTVTVDSLTAGIPLGPLDRTLAVGQLRDHSPRFWYDRQPLVLMGCRANSPPDSKGMHRLYGFSEDGEFGEDYYLVNVRGFNNDHRPMQPDCYEMLVRYEETDEYCYWSSNYLTSPPLPPQITGKCPGWTQNTPLFALVSEDSWRPVRP